ncbi:E domain-containing protein [Staphylococcus aureus]|nr:E domain-containing protein [Staphylococcus aureus]
MKRKCRRVHENIFDPNLATDQTEEVPGKPGIKNPDTGEN